MRRSAAPSSNDLDSRKRFKFNSPVCSANQNLSPKSLSLRKLEDTETYLNLTQNKEQQDGLQKITEIEDSLSLNHNVISKRVQIKKTKFVVPKQKHSINKRSNSVDDIFLQKKGPTLNDSHTYTSDPSCSKAPKRCFKVLFTKLSKKKHKTWEDDGVIFVDNNIIDLKDDKNKSLAKKTKCTKTEIDALKCGYSFVIGGKDVLIDKEISVENQRVKIEESCTIQHASSDPHNPMLNDSKFLSICPGIKSGLSKPKARHNPSAANAVVLSEDSDTSVAIVLDPFLSGQMRLHQIEGTKFLYKCVMGDNNMGSGVILADEMGLGKTLQCIALIWTLLKQGPRGYPVCKQVLIITPSSLVSNWKYEFKKWLGDERVKVWGLTAGESSVKDFSSSPLYPVLVISYEMFRNSIKEALKIDWGLIVCDEGHRLKKNTGKIGEAFNQLSCRRRVILTGTPVQNNLKEFYSLVNFVNPAIFGDAKDFSSIYADPIQASLLPTATESQKTLGKKRSEELSVITSQFILRRTNKINEKFLPCKEEHILFCKASAALKEKYSTFLSDTDPLTLPSTGIFELITKLKKVCNHPCLADEGEAGFKKVNVSDSSKLVVSSDLIMRQTKKGHKIVLVSHYTQTLDILGYLCDSLQLQYHRLDGKTPQSKRQNMVDLFNSTYDKRMVFLLSNKAGGVGLNLIGGNVMVLYDIDWNPANDHQAMARVWRDGQRREVEIYRLVTTGTIEEKIFQRQIRKQGLSNCVVNNEMEQCSFSLNDLRDIFSYNFETDSMTHDLLNCSCDGSHRPQTIQPTSTKSCYEEEDSKGYMNAELMSWEHSHHSDPNITFEFVKRKSPST